MPRSISIPIGADGNALTVQRVWIALMLIYFLVAYFHKSRVRIALRSMLRQHATLILVISLLVASKLISTLLYGDARHLLYFADDVLFSVFAFTLFYCYSNDPRWLNKILFMMVAGMCVTALLVPIEMFRGVPILSGLIDTAVHGSDVALSTKSRAESQRVQVFFDHPLLLTEFIVLTLPIAYFLRKELFGWKRRVTTFSILAAPLVLFTTGSRSGILVGSITTFVYIAATYWRQMRIRTKIIVTALMFVLVTLAANMAVSFIIEQGERRQEVQIWEYDEQERSTMERASQYLIVFGAVFNGQYLGYGVKQDYEKELAFLNNIDNYLLRVMLEGGVLAIILFLVAILIFFAKAKFLLMNGRNPSDTRLASAMIGFLASFVLMKLFISMPTNNIYLYMVFGAFLGTRWPVHRLERKSHNPVRPIKPVLTN